MKKITKILFALILCLTLLNVNAKSVKINGDNDDIYQSGGSGSAKFNKDTNTLILDHYTGGCIYFDGFDDETVSIVVAGDSIISSPTYNDAYAAIGLETSTDNTNIEIIGDSSGSYSLEFTNYRYGIFVNDSDITIKNIILGIHDISYVGLYSVSGDVYIKDSTIDSYKTEGFGSEGDSLYVISCDEGNAYLDNVSYTSLNSYTDIYAYGDINIKDSNFDIDGSGYLTWCSYLDIKDSDITFDDTDYILYAYYDINIDHVNVTGDDASDIIYSDYYGTGSVTNCIINVKNVSDAIIAYTNDTVMKNINITADTVPYPIYLYGDAELDNVTVDISNVDYYLLYFFDNSIESNVVIKNSNFKADSIAEYFALYFENNNSTFNAYNTTFKGTKVNMFLDDSSSTNTNIITFEKCNIDISTDEIDDDSLTGFLKNKLVIKDSTFKADLSGDGLASLNVIEIDNSDISITSEYGMAIIIASNENFDLDDKLIIKNTNLRENNLIKATTNMYDTYYASLFSSQPESSYDNDNVSTAIALSAKTVHYDATKNPKTGDSLSYYITLSILSIMTITSCYYVLNKNN